MVRLKVLNSGLMAPKNNFEILVIKIKVLNTIKHQPKNRTILWQAEKMSVKVTEDFP